MTTRLRAEGLSRSFASGGSAFRLEVEHLRLDAGARVAVTGPSGCGKSTLLAILALALEPAGSLPPLPLAGEGRGEGGSPTHRTTRMSSHPHPNPLPPAGEGISTLDLAGTDALSLWRTCQLDALAALRSQHLGFVPQTGSLLPFLTLRANIALPLRLQGRTDPVRVAQLAERLGIAAVLDRMPSSVSVGQRQRAAVARALVHRPGLVLADEPTASVHPTQADEILHLLTEAAEDGTALVISTHDAARAQAAGFAIAPCRPDPALSLTRFAWS